MNKFTLLFWVLLVASNVFGQFESSSRSEIPSTEKVNGTKLQNEDAKRSTKSVIIAPWSTDFADNLIPENWGNFDVDGDGYFWETTEINSGVYGLISETFRMDIYDALTPDNYLTTTKVDLSALTNPVMNWKVMAISDTDFAEHYSIYISTTGNTVADFTDAAIFSETLAEGGVQLDRSISLAGYGNEIWIAFRNHDCTNQFFLAIPELAFAEGEPVADPVIIAPWSTNFADNLIPENWGNFDVDGDGYFWETTEINSGVYGLISETFRMDIYDALTPDNYLTTTKVDLSALTNPVMNWKVMAISDTDFAEHYSIYISTTGNTVADFTDAAIFSETLAEGGVQLDRSISLAGYGNEIWIAFRNHDCTNQFFLAIPELAFAEGEPVADPVIIAPWSTNFADNLIPENWGNFDVDGDGYFWETTEINSGVYGLISETFRMDIYDALTPDNYLTTTKVDLSALTNPVMNWKVMAISDTDFAEHYSIYISTTGNTVADFTDAAIFSETLAEGGVQLDRSISLAGYGNEIWIAFRNHDCTNQFFLAIPELAFAEGEPVADEAVTFNVDMNNVETTIFDPAVDIVTISGSFTDPTWQEPTLTDLTFSDDDADGIYSLTLALTTNGSYEYKYYVNAGLTGVEWEGGLNRSFDFAGETLVLNDVFGDEPVSIKNVSSTKVNAYPNPTSDIFTLDLEEYSMVTIFNIAGQKVYNNFINGQTSIDLSNVETGIYMINIVNDNYSTQTKIIKK
ncbi:MAG: choice-of-anchor J domain-containing protein [Salinivirgaceae bacterium]|nr:choice-of-anchor J domain-containing protein [Salinivirgaceae bacterium]